jgi:hypothetical protein
LPAPEQLLRREDEDRTNHQPPTFFLLFLEFSRESLGRGRASGASEKPGSLNPPSLPCAGETVGIPQKCLRIEHGKPLPLAGVDDPATGADAGAGGDELQVPALGDEEDRCLGSASIVIPHSPRSSAPVSATGRLRLTARSERVLVHAHYLFPFVVTCEEEAKSCRPRRHHCGTSHQRFDVPLLGETQAP